MIWVAGEIVPDKALGISVLDRTFEHGLGLFETLRTWNGHPTLLDRHLARLKRSAAELRLPLDPAALPDADAVAALVRASGIEGDAMLRITMSGGLSETAGAVVWMRAAPLPPPLREGVVRVEGYWPVLADDLLARHKALNYWNRRLAYEQARAEGFDEMLSISPDRKVWEGSRTNLFVVFGPLLSTPRADGPLVPGVMRSVVLEWAKRLGLEVGEGELGPDGLRMAHEAFLTNAVRGIIPIAHLVGHRLPAPGPWTKRLWEDILPWLASGGRTP
ncbi:MAG: aminotransferase class IV [Isosphaeraceae bacterium]|nr:aminotransferase class IV [Isosphaeraceae bacterium]